MDFEQLNAFLEVARNASFSRAAKKLFRTQPAISAQIRALEDDIGARLFDRTGGRVTLTAGGKLFLEYAQDALQSQRSIVRALAEVTRTPRGVLVVSANEATCLYILPQVFAQFKRKYPRVSVSITRNERSRTLEAVLSQEVDFGVTAQPVTDPRLTIVPVHQDEMVVIAPVGHPLAARRSTPLAQVAAFPLILPKQGRTRDAIDQLFTARHLKPEISMELDSNEIIKRFTAAGVGVGFLARSNTTAEHAAGLLAVVELEDARIARDLVLIYRKDKSLSRAAQAFIEIMQKQRMSSEAATIHRTAAKP